MLLINTDSHKVAYANRELLNIIGAGEECQGSSDEVQERVKEFIMQDLDT